MFLQYTTSGEAIATEIRSWKSAAIKSINVAFGQAPTYSVTNRLNFTGWYSRKTSKLVIPYEQSQSRRAGGIGGEEVHAAHEKLNFILGLGVGASQGRAPSVRLS